MNLFKKKDAFESLEDILSDFETTQQRLEASAAGYEKLVADNVTAINDSLDTVSELQKQNDTLNEQAVRAASVRSKILDFIS